MSSNLHMAWARLFVRALARSGVTDAVLSPGSRSAPLAIALAEESALRLHVIVDERAAAFFALGQARVTGRPSVLVCTSGTAGAHYLPAIIEAAQSFLPMIAVTADRPWELQDAAAPQTIDQLKLFGDFVRCYAELGLPDAAPTAMRAVPRIAAQAVARAIGPIPGPVHVNARFRKPLEPVPVSVREPWEPLFETLLEAPIPRFVPSRRAVDPRVVAEVAERIGRAARGLIACGPAPLQQARGRDAILSLARRTGLPLFAEATSQVRFGGDRSGVIEGGPVDALLLATPAVGPVDFILQLGAPPTSSLYAEACGGCSTRIAVAEHGWNDPQSNAQMLIEADPVELAEALAKELAPPRSGSWSTEARAVVTRASSVLASNLEARGRRAAPTHEALFEGEIARGLLASMPRDALLVVGNSTPVRDLDVFCEATGRSLRVAHQRGASGIDGLVAGAAGAASVDGPTALLLGDVSLLHDLSSLVLAARADKPLVIVVVQNGGGRIFDQLPVAKAVGEALFERCFGTDQRVSFGDAARAFGVAYSRVATKDELDATLAEAWSRPRATLVEAVAEPRERARRVQELWAQLREPPTKATGHERP